MPWSKFNSHYNSPYTAIRSSSLTWKFDLEALLFLCTLTLFLLLEKMEDLFEFGVPKYEQNSFLIYDFIDE